MASKGVAAVLNLLFWGAGYLYLGKRKILGGGLLIGFMLMHMPILYLGMDWFMKSPGLYAFIAHLVISFTLAYDVLVKTGK